MTGKDRDNISWPRELVKDADKLMEATMANVTEVQAHWIPPGVAMPIRARYARVVLSQDGAVNGAFKAGAPLFCSRLGREDRSWRASSRARSGQAGILGLEQLEQKIEGGPSGSEKVRQCRLRGHGRVPGESHSRGFFALRYRRTDHRGQVRRGGTPTGSHRDSRVSDEKGAC